MVNELTPQTVLRLLDPQKHLDVHLSNGVRFDGRKLGEARPVDVSLGCTLNAAVFGSSTVHSRPSSGTSIGVGTKCVCNISVQIGRPSLEKPHDGDLTFDVALSPSLCDRYDTDYAARKKHDDAVDLEGFLRNIWCPSTGAAEPALDLTQLCIEPGRHAYRLVVSLLFLSLDGNMQDCAVQAVSAALRNTSLPKAVLSGSSGPACAVSRETLTPLVVEGDVSARTFAVVTTGEYSDDSNRRTFLRDPTLAEEALVGGTVTVVTDLQARRATGGLCLRGLFVDAVDNCGGEGVTEAGISQELLATLLE